MCQHPDAARRDAALPEEVHRAAHVVALQPAKAQPLASGFAVPAEIEEQHVKAVLRELAKSKKQKLNYDKSIVDLLKLLDLDSSLTARQELAKELGYSGNTKGSSKMNVWLHKEVMRQLAANGGKVPKTWMA